MAGRFILTFPISIRSDDTHGVEVSSQPPSHLGNAPLHVDVLLCEEGDNAHNASSIQLHRRQCSSLAVRTILQGLSGLGTSSLV